LPAKVRSAEPLGSNPIALTAIPNPDPLTAPSILISEGKENRETNREHTQFLIAVLPYTAV
jgi:hypothetical protein